MKQKTADRYRLLLIAIVSIVYIFPFLWMISNSFMSDKNIFSVPPKFFPDLLFTSQMFDNYKNVFSQYNFGLYTINSLWVYTLAAFGQVIVCSLAGFALATMYFRGKNILFSLLILTLMIPVQVTIIPEYYLFLKLNWMDTYLPLIVPSFLAGAFGTFMLKEFFSQVPSPLFDAGIIDGVNAYQMFFRIYLPQASSPIATLFIIAFMNNWNDLLRPMLYISSRELYTVTIALSLFQNQYGVKWNLLLAGSVLSVLPLIVVFAFSQRYIIESTMSSGIKG
ncbi:carbohydrate ABC transporter permease [Sphaerochaeta sp. UBA5849]|uniref:carbohydrate ABC transporter permease n=1 Tax=Sphaerochaeta sp. UBA5849 TaxID=1947475 RepID=UPI002636F636|nr:carbohydrate ABC transporter permease [uncultured Sphaerochaeta sp.]